MRTLGLLRTAAIAAAALAAISLPLARAAKAKATPPHIVFNLVDDWGWANFGLHNPNNTEVVTPQINALAEDGILLDRHYVYRLCSPSRCALQSGRNPIHVNVLNSPIVQHNPADPVGGYQGMPTNMTGIAEKLTAAGYAAHQVGKWNVGMATHRHTPVGRGYNSSLGYFNYDTFFWNGTIQSCGNGSSKVMQTDLWDTNGPAHGENNSWTCSQTNQPASCIYQDDAFVTRVLDIINNHDPSTPLFLFWAPHAPHDPYEVPQAYLDKFSHVDQVQRRYYSAMVNLLDDHVGVVVAALKAKGMWDNLLWVSSSDNGGPVGSGFGGNNWPLAGGKASNWEGGVRVNAYATGGLIPAARRGTVETGFTAIEDWYTTFAGLAGVSADDPVAAAAGLPPVDGLDLWPLLSGANTTSPHEEMVLGAANDEATSPTTVQGIIRAADGWKLLIGEMGQYFHQGPVYPNASGYPSGSKQCGDPAAPAGSAAAGPGCLFNVLTDPNEEHDVAGDHPTLVKELRARIAAHQAGVYSPDRGGDDGAACAAAARYSGFWGPFIGV